MGGRNLPTELSEGPARDFVVETARPSSLRPQPAGIDLQPVQVDDEPVLFEIYASTRAEEMALVGWTPAQQEAFLHMQYEAQRQSYRSQFPAAEYRLVRRDGYVAGRLIVDRSTEELLVLDIALLPAHRDAGIGSALMFDLMAEASRSRKLIRLHVERFNRALNWYQRLGFATVREDAVYLEMEWHPEEASQ
jgi:ribosomal protein S18 acetylase RimI-like enzyme